MPKKKTLVTTLLLQYWIISFHLSEENWCQLKIICSHSDSDIQVEEEHLIRASTTIWRKTGCKRHGQDLEITQCRFKYTHINTFSEFNHNTFVQMLSTFVFRCLLSHTNLFLSESNRKGMQVKEKQLYPDHLGRFDRQLQVHSKDSLTGHCYWEVEWRKRIWVVTTVI